MKKLLATEGSKEVDQCSTFLLEARARELIGVASRNAKRKQKLAVSQDTRSDVIIRVKSLLSDPKPL